MWILVPEQIVLNSSDISEPDTDEPAEWDSANTYNDGDQVTVSQAEDGSAVNTYTNGVHQKYQNDSGATSTDKYPPDNPTIWTSKGATNRWKMFDDFANTQTINSGSISIEINNSSYGIAIIDAQCETITFTEPGHGSYVKDFSYVRSSISHITHYGDGFTGMGINIDASSLDAKCATLAIGRLWSVGDTQFPINMGLIDKSIKQEDADGNIYLEQGNYRKTASCDVWIDNFVFDGIFRFLIENRGKALVFVVDDREAPEYDGFHTMIIYGFLRQFDLVMSKPTHSLLNLEIESLT